MDMKTVQEEPTRRFAVSAFKLPPEFLLKIQRRLFCSCRVACEPEYFYCAAEGMCMPNHWRCDTFLDCADPNDEIESECGAFLTLHQLSIFL